MTGKKPYAGMFVLGLREAHIFSKVRAIIRAGNGKAVAVATHQIQYLEDCEQATHLLDNQNRFAWAIFASPTSVAALRHIAVRQGKQFDLALPVAGPGIHTAHALRNLGFLKVASPTGASSFAALLASNLLGKIAGKRIALIQRADAPMHAASQLARKKAVPYPVACYQRSPAPANMWTKLDEVTRAKCNCILAYEAESAAILLDRAGDDAERLCKLPIGIHNRQIENKIARLGFENIIVEPNPELLLAKLAARLNAAAN